MYHYAAILDVMMVPASRMVSIYQFAKHHVYIALIYVSIGMSAAIIHVTAAGEIVSYVLLTLIINHHNSGIINIQFDTLTLRLSRNQCSAFS